MSLTVETHQKQGICTLYIKGILDYSTINHFNDCVDDLSGISKVIVDLTSLEFIDSTGIGAVLDLIYVANEKEVSMEFKGLSEEVKEIFDTVGVFRVIESIRRRS